MSRRNPIPAKRPAVSKSVTVAPPEMRLKSGLSLRGATPRSAHAAWQAPDDRADPVEILIAQGATRIPSLLPERYERMAVDPFAFLRGSAAIMAADLSRTPSCGFCVQSGGDAHLGNFGSYASPEGAPVFDINDFDETAVAPFEWDIKRLATSFVVAGRVAGYAPKPARRLAVLAVAAYREQTAAMAGLTPVDAWNTHIDLKAAISEIEQSKLRSRIEKHLSEVLASGAQHFNLIRQRNGALHLPAHPPLVHRLDAHDLPARQAFASYAGTLQEDRRVLLQRYELRDVAFKVVGVGSVGTFCAIALLTAGDGSPLLLQIKEAQSSVVAPFVERSAYANNGERVVVGQRMLQAASDIFLGWTREPIDGRWFYIRRLKDPRLAGIGTRLEAELPFYARLCGRTLARAHARAGDPVLVSGYIGKGPAFEEAVADFAVAYADQTEKDWAAFCDAIKSGRISPAKPSSPKQGRRSQGRA